MRVLQRNAAAGATGCRRGDLNRKNILFPTFLQTNVLCFTCFPPLPCPLLPFPVVFPLLLSEGGEGVVAEVWIKVKKVETLHKEAQRTHIWGDREKAEPI